MRIGVDFDNTIVNTKETVRKFLDMHGITQFKTEEEKTCFYMKYIENIGPAITVKEDAVEVLNCLKEKHELYLITNRNNFYNPNYIEITKKHIIDNNIPIDNLYFNVYEKGKLCKELNIDVFIDDDINNCLDVKSKGIPVLLFGNTYEGLETVNNWKEVLARLEEYDGRESFN